METCYQYPYDLLSLLFMSVTLNFILSIFLLKKIKDHSVLATLSEKIAKAMKEANVK